MEDEFSWPHVELTDEQVEQEREREALREQDKVDRARLRSAHLSLPFVGAPDCLDVLRTIAESPTLVARLLPEWRRLGLAFEVDIDGMTPESVRGAVKAMPCGSDLVRIEDSWFLAGGDARFAAFACERQGYVKKVVWCSGS